MTSAADELAEIEATLASGVDNVNVDGRSVHRDFEALRQRRDELRRQLQPTTARPRVQRFDLSGY